MPKKGHAMFCNMSPKREHLFSGNKNPRFWDIGRAEIILLHPLKTSKPFSRKQESPILGHQCPHFGAIFKHGVILIKTIFDKFRPYMVS